MNAVAIEAGLGIFENVSRVLGMRVRSEEDILQATSRGLPVRAYNKADKIFGFPAGLIGSATTIRRRQENNAPLSRAESEALVRVLRVFAEAAQLYGDDAKAIAWMKRPAKYLEGRPPVSPLVLSATDSGARLMEAQITKTAYGMPG